MRIVLIAGSNRKEATSRKLVGYMASQLEAMGHEAIIIDLYQWQLPPYCPDVKQAATIVNHFRESLSLANAIVLATPEYHGSISGVLKNALDYVTQEHMNNKVILSVSSAGGAVGVSSLTHLQTIVRNLHGINCPEWISIGGDGRQFTEGNQPLDTNIIHRIQRTLHYFLILAEQARLLT